MRFGIPVKQLMRKDFLIVDINLQLSELIKKYPRSENFAVINNGNFEGILGESEILSGLMKGKKTMKEILPENHSILVDANADLSQILEIFNNEKADSLVVKEDGIIKGVVTMKEILKFEPFLFEKFISKSLHKYENPVLNPGFNVRLAGRFP